MLRKLMWISAGVLIAVLAFSAITTYAQGPGNGNGRGFGPHHNPSDCPFFDGETAQGYGPMMGRGGMMGQQGGQGYGPMMGGRFNADFEPVETLDAAVEVANNYLSDEYTLGEGIELTEGFYFPVYENDVAVFELWINRETGFVMGMQMNRFGMRFWADDEIDFTLEDATAAASEYLAEGQTLGEALVIEDHYTFTVLEGDAIVALFKVSGHTGHVMIFE
ncbi:MAG: hypothetical protein L0154_23045 [Chloroflexi bacterium]|nr:hypothetical protein [Chloroflexota bacterium]